jgi:hypothetical protein
MPAGKLVGARAALLCSLLAAAAATAGGSEAPPVELPPVRPGTLDLRLVNHETRAPTSARVRVSGGGHDWGAAGRDGWSIVEGRLTLSLPPGEYRVRVDGGRRRLPYDARVTIASGAAELRTVYLMQPEYLAFERKGWLVADPLVSPGKLSVREAALAAEAAGLTAGGIERLRAAEAPKLRGRLPTFGWEGSVDLRAGTRLHLWGGGEIELSGYADCGRPRRFDPWQEAIPWDRSLERFYGLAGSRPLATRGIAPRMYWELAAGGSPGCFELEGSESSERMWFALLRQGYRLPAVAGSRADLGSGGRPEPRMLVCPEVLPGKARRSAGDALVGALAAGRSTVSFGPFCLMSVDGAGPGAELPAVERDRRMKITAAATTDRRAEISRVEIYRDGELMRRIDVPPERVMVEPELLIRQEEPAWFVAKCWQRIRNATDAEAGETCALTNPIWIEAKAYSTRPKPVLTKVVCRIVDAATGKELAAEISGRGPVKPVEGLEPAGKSAEPDGWRLKCASGRFVLEASAAAPLRLAAPGYAEHRLDIIELGLDGFAARHAAMTPKDAERSLCDPATMDSVRRLLATCKLTVQLRRLASPQRPQGRPGLPKE